MYDKQTKVSKEHQIMITMQELFKLRKEVGELELLNLKTLKKLPIMFLQKIEEKSLT